MNLTLIMVTLHVRIRTYERPSPQWLRSNFVNLPPYSTNYTLSHLDNDQDVIAYSWRKSLLCLCTSEALLSPVITKLFCNCKLATIMHQLYFVSSWERPRCHRIFLEEVFGVLHENIHIWRPFSPQWLQSNVVNLPSYCTTYTLSHLEINRDVTQCVEG